MVGHLEPSSNFRSAAARSDRISRSRRTWASSRRLRLKAVRHRSEHASRFRPSRKAPQTVQTGCWEAITAERSASGGTSGAREWSDIASAFLRAQGQLRQRMGNQLLLPVRSDRGTWGVAGAPISDGGQPIVILVTSPSVAFN